MDETSHNDGMEQSKIIVREELLKIAAEGIPVRFRRGLKEYAVIRWEDYWDLVTSKLLGGSEESAD